MRSRAERPAVPAYGYTFYSRLCQVDGLRIERGPVDLNSFGGRPRIFSAKMVRSPFRGSARNNAA